MADLNTDDQFNALFGITSTEEEKPKEEPTVTGPDMDMPVVEETGKPEQPESSFSALFGVPEPVPAGTEEEAPQIDVEKAASVTDVIPTSLQDFYGEDLIRQEQELLNRRMGQGGTGEFTQVEGGGLSAQDREALDNIQRIKQEKYDAVSGPNVSDYGVFGKILTQEDGSSKYLPSPQANEASQLYLKTASDTMRGLLGLPEFFGQEGYQNLIPEVASKDEAVVLLAELGQLTMGALGGLTAVEKAKKITQLADKFPSVATFLRGGMQKIDTATPDWLKKTVELTKMSAEDLAKLAPKGTIPSTAGMVATADEDVATLFGEPNMTMAEAKMQMMYESLAFGVLLGSAGAVGEVTKVAPGIRYLVRNVSAGLSALFASPKKADQQVIEKLGQIVLENNKKLANATTPDEVQAAYEATLNEVRTTYKQITGQDLDEILAGTALPDPESYVPTIGEAFGDEALLRFRKALEMSKGKDNANAILREVLNQNEIDRLNALEAQQARARTELAPTGPEAGEQVVEELRPQIQQETEALLEVGATERAAVRAETEAQRQAAMEAEQQALARAEAPVEEATAGLETTVKQAEKTLSESYASRSTLDDLDQIVAQDGTAVQVNQVLKDDLAVKRRLGTAKDGAYGSIVIPPEEAVAIADELILNIANPRFLISESQIRGASKALQKLIYKFQGKGVEVPPTTPPTPGAPTPTPKPAPTGTLQEQLAQLEKELLNPALTAQELMDISERISVLLKKGVTKPTAGVAQAAPEVVEELPTITALDLEDITIYTRRMATKANQQALSQGSREFKQVADGLNEYANTLSARLNNYVELSDTAVQARDEFQQFYTGFKERWRTATGKEWEGDIINAKTEADIADISERIIKVFANPKAKEADLVQIRNIVDEMPEEAKQQFIQDMGVRVIANFTRAKGVTPALEGGITSIKQARQLVTALDNYMSGLARYEKTMPGVLDQLKVIRENLNSLAGRGEKAVTAKAGAEAEAKVAVKGAKEKRATEERMLSADEQEKIREIDRRLREAQKVVDRSTLQKLLDVDDPTAFLGGLLRSKTGVRNFQELWSRAGTTGTPLETGVTSAQQALRESMAEALLNRVYTPVQQLKQSKLIALTDLAPIILDEKSVPGRIFRIAYQNDPAGLEFIQRLGRASASYQRSLTGGQIPRTATAEVSALQNLVTDIQMVAFGPLTKDFRLARFITRMTFGAAGAETKIAEAFARVLTQPEYYGRVLEQARKLASQGLVAEEEAFRIAFGSAIIGAAGTKKYMQMEDPREEILRDVKQYATMQQTEEALPAPEAP